MKVIAFYLPQYHPIPENDRWWGKGFTEWTNVTRARPLFRGHYQPHLPADLGYYDLRLSEARQAQADLARAYGVYGFCYYHYWFNGYRLLERPLNEMVAAGQPDLPFCLCWANENWTRRWDGMDGEVLRTQVYSPEDDRTHLQSLLPILTDRRYIRVDDRPLLLVYRVNSLPDPTGTAARWREEAQSAGLPGLFLVNVMSHPEARRDPTTFGFDAAVDFQPDWSDRPSSLRSNLAWRAWRKLTIAGSDPYGRNSVMRYADLVMRMTGRPEPKFTYFPGVALGWDNSPRRKSGAMIYVGSTPELYGRWLTHAKNVADRRSASGQDFVFVNAWNEWAEGTHLEPDQKWGTAYLEVTRTVLRGG